MDILKNVVSENRVEKIRLIDPEHYVVGGQPVGDWDTPNDNNAHYDLACTAQFLIDEFMNLKTEDAALKKYIRDLIYLVCPVGTRKTSHHYSPSTKYWQNVTGEWFREKDLPELWAYYVGLGRPIVNGLMQAIDERGTVARHPNLGRFSDVAEIGLGQYQADATQRVVGTLGEFVYQDERAFDVGVDTGVFDFKDPSIYSRWGGYSHVSKVQNIEHLQGGGNRRDGFIFDNAIVARTALEERVKATGIHVQVFCGLGDI